MGATGFYSAPSRKSTTACHGATATASKTARDAILSTGSAATAHQFAAPTAAVLKTIVESQMVENLLRPHKL